mmetsp:Transcript_12502/g.31758  ORF Transcript_12502/g.31758 Transcript_12502/m.31758 type:complete len:167 (-) Transcript_12502:664-1164(-)|eukprot:CAMPEP_0198237848 /NCGR_PEP_ID=MMETSP1446-20131203/3634_1 /TAXON_ID=1461542 ORGANISM="Unidentified sp, Strain CCMP2111" /NCGR_SAMPLE_ID=MMETSP1446 /ASSEMBLY_ACC=CAM_ASM_001112 /LENGTH=166 /DNA_ID=CAMNT_0043920125 /DNA_START=291 /DNA_END=791 /DNA_ORIENTATION=+
MMMTKFLQSVDSASCTQQQQYAPTSKLQRIPSEPYSVQATRMEAILQRTLTDDSEAKTQRSNGSFVSKSSMRRRDSFKSNPEDMELKKSVSWVDKKIPGRSLSDIHVITPRSVVDDYHCMETMQRTSSRLSVVTSYYFQTAAARERGNNSSCSSCLVAIRTALWGI